MNQHDRRRLEQLVVNIHQLMDVPPSMNPVVTNAEIIEATIWDIQQILMGKNVAETAVLIARDFEAEAERLRKRQIA